MKTQGTSSIRIIVINLDTDTDRRRRVESRLRELGLSWERLPGVDGRHLGPEHDAFVDRDAQAALGVRNVSLGAIGCWLSHRRALQMLIEGGDEMCLILEDDIRIRDDLPEMLELIKHGDIGDFHVIRLHRYRQSRRYTPIRDIDSSHTLGLVRFYDYGTLAYIITRKAAMRFIEKVPRMVHLADGAMNRSWEHGIVTLYIDPPVVTHEDHGLSSIKARPGRRHHGFHSMKFWLRGQCRQIGDWYPKWSAYHRILKDGPAAGFGNPTKPGLR